MMWLEMDFGEDGTTKTARTGLTNRFYPSGRKSSHLRVSFSIIEQDEAELGLSRLAEAIREAREAIAAAK